MKEKYLNLLKQLWGFIKSSRNGTKEKQGLNFIQKLVLKIVAVFGVSALLGAGYLWLIAGPMDPTQTSPDIKPKEVLRSAESKLDNLMCINPESKLCKDHLKNMVRIKKEFTEE